MKLMKNLSKYILIAVPTLLLLSVLVFFLLKLPTKEKQRRYDDLVTLANSQFEQKEYAKSLSSFNDAAVILNNRYEAYEGIAKLLVLKNQLGQLTDLINKSSTLLLPEHKAKLYSYIGEGYLKVGNYDQAIENYKKAYDSDNSNETAKIGLAKSYLSFANTQNAKELLDISKESENYELAYVLKLISSFSKLEDIKSNLEQSVEFKNENYKKTVDDFKAVAKVDAVEDLYISTLLSRIYVNNGYSKLAISLLEPLTEKLMEYQDGIYVLASAYYNVGDKVKAITLLKDYSNPNSNPDLYLLLARSYKGVGEFDEAYKYYELAGVSSGDKSEEVYIEYTAFLLDQAQYVKAKSVLDNLDKKLNEIWIDTNYLKMYVLQKNNPKAQFYLDKLSKSTNMIDSEKKEYLFWSISQYIEEQKNNDAIILLAKLKEIDKYNPQYYYLAGKLHLQTANINEAKSELEQAIDYDLTGQVTENAKKLLSRVN